MEALVVWLEAVAGLTLVAVGFPMSLMAAEVVLLKRFARYEASHRGDIGDCLPSEAVTDSPLRTDGPTSPALCDLERDDAGVNHRMRIMHNKTTLCFL